MRPEKKKIVALISGGLDSILAARVMMDQGFDIIGLYGSSAFSKSYGDEHRTHAARVSQEVGFDLKIMDLGNEYIDLIRNPGHGYGKNSNPCIDCKIYMLQKARSVMEEIGAPFLVTGEVLGQRPMSQRRDTLHVIERDAGMKGSILRPLSAKLLPPTKAEQDGTVDRERLFGISGRSRSIQLQLAERYGIRGFSAPAGGCLLTDKNFSDKLMDLFRDKERVSPADIRLLTLGRHFRLESGIKVVVGRNKGENTKLIALADDGYHLFFPHGFRGPVALLDGEPTAEIKHAVARLIITYSKLPPGTPQHIRFGKETIDAGTPLPVTPTSFKRVGTDH